MHNRNVEPSSFAHKRLTCWHDISHRRNVISGRGDDAIRMHGIILHIDDEQYTIAGIENLGNSVLLVLWVGCDHVSANQSNHQDVRFLSLLRTAEASNHE